MKFNKNNVQTISLLLAAFGLIMSIFYIISDRYIFASIDDSALLFMATVMITLLTIYTTAFTVFQRINPKKNIYISYASDAKEIAEMIISEMNEQFKKTSKYRFELFTVDSVHYGYDIKETVESYIEKTDIVIIIVSPKYINSEWCKNEFCNLISKEKTIIPIITDSFEDLSRLPKNLSNIKALSLIDTKTQDDIQKQLSKLVFDLIRQRKD